MAERSVVWPRGEKRGGVVVVMVTTQCDPPSWDATGLAIRGEPSFTLAAQPFRFFLFFFSRLAAVARPRVIKPPLNYPSGPLRSGWVGMTPADGEIFGSKRGQIWMRRLEKGRLELMSPRLEVRRLPGDLSLASDGPL